MTAGDAYDPSAPKGGTVAGIFCGNCCRKDTKFDEIQLPNDAPIQYAKADNVSLAGLEPHASRDKSKDESTKAGGVDTRLPPKVHGAAATSGGHAEHDYTDEDHEDSEEEEEEPEESEEETEHTGAKTSHQATVAALRSSWGALKVQMDNNPKPKWMGTRQSNMKQAIDEEETEEEDDPTSSPEARKHEIAKLKASFSNLAEKLDKQESYSRSQALGLPQVQKSSTANPSARTSGLKHSTASCEASQYGSIPNLNTDVAERGPSQAPMENLASSNANAAGSMSAKELGSMEANCGSRVVNGNLNSKNKKGGKCTVM